MLRRVCLAILCLVFAVQAAPIPESLPAQTLSHPDVSQRFSHFINLSRVNAQLAQSTTVLQDQLGYLWIGTQHGLYRFDGRNNIVFHANPDSNNALSAEWITSLLLDKQGMIWIGTRYGGLNRYNPSTEQFSHIALKDLPGGLSQVEISALYQDKQGELWVGTFGGGLYQWDSANAQLKQVQLPFADNEADWLFINSIYRDDAGYLWLGTGSAPLRSRNVAQGGLLRWHPSTNQYQTFTPDNSALSVAAVSAIRPDPKGHIYVTSYGGGLYQFDSATNRLQAVPRQPAALQQSLATDLAFDGRGGLWVSTYDQGLWHQAAASSLWQQYQANPSVSYQLGSHNLTGLLFDQQQTLWITSPVGVFGLSAEAQVVRNIPAGPQADYMLSYNDVFGICEDDAGFIWLANRDGGLVRLQLPEGRLTQIGLPGLLAGMQKAPLLARQVVASDPDHILVGTDQGLVQYEQSSQSWRFIDLLPGHAVHVGFLLKDGTNRIWVGSRGHGLFYGERGDFKQVKARLRGDARLETQSISVVHADDQGYLWIGLADQGLARLHMATGTLEHWQAADGSGLRFDGVQLLHQEAGQMWVRAGNVRHRVLFDDKDPHKVLGFKAYPNDQAPDKYLARARQFQLIYRVLVDDYSEHQLSDVHGFQNTTWIGALYIDAKGTMYRGGSQGLDIYHIDQLPQSRRSAQVRLTGLTLFNKAVSVQEPQQTVLQQAIGYAEQIQLRYEQDMLSIQFSALDLVDPDAIHYQYKLTGFDRDWIETSPQNPQATYTRLAPGRYRFEVMAKMAGSAWNTEAIRAIDVIVSPPWWLTWWFKILLLLSVLSALWLLLQYRLRHERLNRRWLEKVVEQRTSELKTQHLALTNSYRNLSMLQTLSRQITASLELKDILLHVQAQLDTLLDAHVLAVGIYRPEHQTLEFNFWLEHGKVMPSFELVLDGSPNLAVVCYQTQREVCTANRQQFLNYLPAIPQPLVGEPMQSVLYFPLTVKGEQVGCFSVQSPKTDAYSIEQIDLLRTLCSTLSIAVANANVVARLQQTRQQLVMQEKMASLGGLVAGVAHEINTPLGICVTAASHLKHELDVVIQAQSQRKLTVQQFSQYLEHADATVKMLMDNTARVDTLVQSFKQVAIDKNAVQVREIDIAEHFAELLQTMQPELRKAHCQLEFVRPPTPGPIITADAGILTQLLSHLVRNSLLHAFLPDHSDRRISVQLSQQGNQLLLQYSDNGQGMAPEQLSRLFEPFFTSKRHQGYSGLGSHIVFNLVTVELQGSIQARSEPGQGLSYRILLPLQRRPD